MNSAAGLAFGADGNLYVASRLTSEVLRFDGTTGAFIDAFVTVESGGLNLPWGIDFGPDGNLYVSSRGTDEVLRFDGETGDFIDAFVTAGSGGLDTVFCLLFGPDGNLYVCSFGTDEVLRYDGETGDFIDAFVAAGSGGLDGPTGIFFFVVQRSDGSDGCTIVSGNKQTSIPLYLILLFTPAMVFIRRIFLTKNL